jgi:hypothetical protein
MGSWENKMREYCDICHKPIESDCDWRQGRCPHRPSMFEQIMSDPYKTRFYNLFKFFRSKKNDS